MTLPRIVITGASGFVGRHLLEALKGRYEIYGIARRSQSRCGAPEHANIHWHQVDIAHADRLEAVFEDIARAGRIDTVVHLAAHYDFDEENEREYYRTNVDGLRNVLENTKKIGIRKLVFSSSVAACAFPAPGDALDEDTPPDGDHIYAKTKAIGEAMVSEYADDFDAVIVRFAALFSDWCEYPPLFMFLQTWLSKAWNSRLLGGKGESAIPYLHVRDAVGFLETVLDQLDRIEPGRILIASPDGSVSHAALFWAATRYYYTSSPAPIFIPKVLARPGIQVRCLLGRITGEMPFERPWMARYIDKRLTIDASRTREFLGWAPRERLEISRRMAFLLENFKSDPVEWNRLNRAAMKQVRMRPNLGIFALLSKHRETISSRFTATLQAKAEDGALPSYRTVGHEEHSWNHRLILRSLMNSVRTRERSVFLAYCEDIAERRFEQGFSCEDLCGALETLNLVCLEVLSEDPDTGDLVAFFHDHITVTIRFGIDHVYEVYELRADRARRKVDAGNARSGR